MDHKHSTVRVINIADNCYEEVTDGGESSAGVGLTSIVYVAKATIIACALRP